jgi:hypothetical protein
VSGSRPQRPWSPPRSNHSPLMMLARNLPERLAIIASAVASTGTFQRDRIKANPARARLGGIAPCLLEYRRPPMMQHVAPETVRGERARSVRAIPELRSALACNGLHPTPAPVHVSEDSMGGVHRLGNLSVIRSGIGGEGRRLPSRSRGGDGVAQFPCRFRQQVLP